MIYDAMFLEDSVNLLYFCFIQPFVCDFIFVTYLYSSVSRKYITFIVCVYYHHYLGFHQRFTPTVFLPLVDKGPNICENMIFFVNKYVLTNSSWLKLSQVSGTKLIDDTNIPE